MTNNNSLPQHTFQCASLVLDLELGLLKNAEGACQRLSPINLKLLSYLLSRAGEVISRAEIFDAVWPNQLLSDDVLTRAVSDIRTQLTKLDATTKFIETLPKRGYRWIEPVRPIALEVSIIDAGDANEPLVQAAHDSVIASNRLVVKFTALGIYFLLALLLACACMWMLSRPILNQLNLAVLPTVAEQSRAESIAKKVDEDLLLVLRNNPRIKLVSRSAIASRPQNPFPYFFDKFGVEWVLESRVTDNETGLRVELSLVDARTGLEVRSLGLEANNNVELLTKLARKLDAEWWADDMSMQR
jgi:DNA-binding winged helix-turn-helix (wHTH) protein/TolB-like protein